MKTIRIFLASSDELRQERTEFADLIEHLNLIFRPKGTELQLVKWEYLDASMGGGRKQDEYNRELASCEVALVLYWHRFGAFTEEELRTAHENNRAGRNPRKLYVFFKETGSDEGMSDALREFKDSFETTFGHFYCRFENVDMLKLNFLLQFEAYFFETEEDGPKLTVEGSRILAGQEPVVALANVPFTANNPEYRRLSDAIQRLEKSVAALKTAAAAAPAVAPVLEEQRRQLAEARRRLDEHERFLFNTALSFACQSGERISTRLCKAKDLFESGRAAEANAVLDFGEIENDLESNLREFEVRRDNALLGVEELCMKVKTTMSDDALDVSDRVRKACDCYRRAADALRGVGAFPERLAGILYEHGRFLSDRGRQNAAIPFLEESVSVFRSISSRSRARMALALNRLGDCKRILARYDEAEGAYRESLHVLEELDGSNPDYSTALGGAHFGRGRVFAAQGKQKLASVQFQHAATALQQTQDPGSMVQMAELFENGAVGGTDLAKAMDLYSEAAERGDTAAQLNLGYMYLDGRGVEQSDEAAVRWFRESAEQGNVFAQNDMGILYLDGRGVEQSDTEAVAWFRKAAEQGNAAAQTNLGIMCRNGRGVKQSDTEAVAWFRKAAEQGNAAAQTNLGFMYLNGRGVEQIDAEAVAWCRKAAEQGNATAQTNLGVMYANGRGVEQSDTEAVAWYRKAAEQGNALGQANLGFMYLNGRGVEQSDAEAVAWYRKAAGRGDAGAQLMLGFMFLNGCGVEQSDAEAVAWCRKAAKQGVAAAQYNLGIMYQNGRGVAQSDAEAVAWYRKAAGQGDAAAQFNLGCMYRNGRGVEQSDAEAVAWYRKAAGQGNADAQLNLGFMYLTGRGVKQSDAGAVAWCRKAAEQGDAVAQRNLGFMYENGCGVKQSDAEAVAWYRKAAERGNAFAGNALAWHLFESGRPEEALPFARMAVESIRKEGSESDKVMVFDTLAAVLDALELSEEAKIVCEEELALFPAGSESELREAALVRLGRACRRLGDAAGAKDAFRQALALVEAHGGKPANYGMSAKELRAALKDLEA